MPMDVDTPPTELAPAAQHTEQSLPEQTTKNDPPKTPVKIVADEQDIDISVSARSILVAATHSF